MDAKWYSLETKTTFWIFNFIVKHQPDEMGIKDKILL